MKLMGSMMVEKQDNIVQIIEAVEVFVLGAIDMMSLFNGDYDQGDFCSGLIFGRDGSGMLLQLATQFVKHSTKESNRPDTKPRPSHEQQSMEEKREAFRQNGAQDKIDRKTKTTYISSAPSSAHTPS
jgi:hypothetical protein